MNSITARTRWTFVVLAAFWVGVPVGFFGGAVVSTMYAEPGAEPSLGLLYTVLVLTIAGVAYATHCLLKPPA